MAEISFPATIVKSDKNAVAKLWLDAPWDNIVRGFAIAYKIKAGTKVRVIFETWENDCSIRAFNLFHALRDKLAEVQEDTSREYKDHLKDCLKLDFGVSKEIAPGRYKLKSTTRYNWKEMGQLIDCTITRCLEEQAPIAHLLQEFKDLKKEQAAIRKAGSHE